MRSFVLLCLVHLAVTCVLSLSFFCFDACGVLDSLLVNMKSSSSSFAPHSPSHSSSSSSSSSSDDEKCFRYVFGTASRETHPASKTHALTKQALNNLTTCCWRLVGLYKMFALTLSHTHTDTFYFGCSCPATGCNRTFGSKRNFVDHWRGHHQGKHREQGCRSSLLLANSSCQNNYAMSDILIVLLRH